MSMTTFTEIVVICSGICSISAALILIIKPLRERVLGIKDVREGQRCLLRADMLSIYYHNREKDQIRQYEKENFIYEYKAYKALGGNSFIDDIYDEVRKWEVVT